MTKMYFTAAFDRGTVIKPCDFCENSLHVQALPGEPNFIYDRVEAKVLSHVTFMPVLLRPVNNFLGQVT